MLFMGDFIRRFVVFRDVRITFTEERELGMDGRRGWIASRTVKY
jgi:hypothetical protein